MQGSSWQCGVKLTGSNFQTLQDKELILLNKEIIRGGISSVMGDHYVKTDEYEKIMYINDFELYGRSMSQLLPCGENNLIKNLH